MLTVSDFPQTYTRGIISFVIPEIISRCITDTAGVISRMFGREIYIFIKHSRSSYVLVLPGVFMRQKIASSLILENGENKQI